MSSAGATLDAKAHMPDTADADAPTEDPVDGAEAGHDAEEDDDEAEAGAEQGADGTAAKKKKRKPKKKKKKAGDSSATLETALQAPNGGTMQNPIDVNDIPSLLKSLSLSEPKKEGKAPEDYKFWNTQPVPKFKEPNLLQTTSGSNGEALPEGAILPDKVCQAAARPEPEKLVDGFEWCLVDLEDADELQELYELLFNHYVEDTEGSFRFSYSKEFLSWALKPPGWKKEWHIGVRTKTEGKQGKLVAFIAGIPVTLKVRQSVIKASEINYLTIHRKLRSKRLAPVLIKEVTRRCYRNGIYQALYTAGTLLPTPISTCRYFHRSLDFEHLYKTGFSGLAPNTSLIRQKYKYTLESKTTIRGLRPMKVADVPAVKALMSKYNERFQLRQDFTEEELTHWLCSDVSKGVVWAYVVEQDGRITDFVSYYLLESTVLRGNKQEAIRAAYLFYYATDSAFAPAGSPTPKAAELKLTLQARLQVLIHDALILAKKDQFHVFNALTLMDNPLFLKEQKFEKGDGKLHYYLFNWRTALLPSGMDAEGNVSADKMGGVGIVML